MLKLKLILVPRAALRKKHAMVEVLSTADSTGEMSLAMEAGDVLIFLAGQVTHGAFKWHGPENRRALLMNYVPSAHFDTRMEFRVPADAKL